MSKIFISYRRADSEVIAGRIYDRLESEFGAEGVFKDVDNIPYGQDFRSVVQSAIENSDVMLVIIGEKWLIVRDKSGNRRLDDPEDLVRFEVVSGLAKPGMLVIPLCVSGAAMPIASDLPEPLTQLAFVNAAVIRNDPDFRRDMARVISTIEEYRVNEAAVRARLIAQPTIQPARTHKQNSRRARSTMGNVFRGVIALAVLAGMIVAGLVSFSIINGLFGSTNPTPIPTITVAQAETETLELAAQTLLQIEPTTTQSPIVSLTPRPATTQPPIVSLTPRPATTQAAFTNGSAQSVAGIDVFALCDNPEFAQPAPAISAGSSVDIYFAWFAATRRQIEDHVASASYDIRLNGIVLPVGEPAFIRPAAAGGYEAYWYVTTGQLAPGEYQISSRVTWRETVFDGVTSFGPGTSIQEETGTCTFQVN